MKIDDLPRMADFAFWAQAAEPALGVQRGAFLSVYQGNRQAAHEVALDAALMVGPRDGSSPRCRRREFGEGTATALLGELNSHVEEPLRRQRKWPGSPRALTGHLKRLVPNLRVVGIGITFSRDPDVARTRKITVSRGREYCVQTVQTVRKMPEGSDYSDVTLLFGRKRGRRPWLFGRFGRSGRKSRFPFL